MKSIKQFLSKFPLIKKILKLLYIYTGGIISNRKTLPPIIECISNTENDNMFGYYDKSPWSRDNNYFIYSNVKRARKITASTEICYIILKNLKTGDSSIIAETSCWNVQQGCMLQWLGPTYDRKIIFNDFYKDRYCAKIVDIIDHSERIIDFPIYTVSQDGKKALSLDFSRLQSFRPGYGYINIKDNTKYEKCPDAPCIWYVDLEKNEYHPILTYQQLYNFETKDNMKNAYHKVNHLMINPSGNRLMFLHRWINEGIKYDRLLTSNLDGTDLYNLLDFDMVSHCNWIDDRRIIAFANTYEYGQGYYILTDYTQERMYLHDFPQKDGHPSISPNGKYIVTDTYPDFYRKQHIYIADTTDYKAVKVAEIYSSVKYRDEYRCDLHPRWNYNSTEICFDATKNGKRDVYILDLRKIDYDER